MRVIIEAVSIRKPLPVEPLADPEIVPVLVRVVMVVLFVANKPVPLLAPATPKILPLLVSVSILLDVKWMPRPNVLAADPEIKPALMRVPTEAVEVILIP